MSGAVRGELSPFTAHLLVDAGVHAVKGRSEPVACFTALASAADLSAFGEALDRIPRHCPEPPRAAVRLRIAALCTGSKREQIPGGLPAPSMMEDESLARFHVRATHVSGSTVRRVDWRRLD